MGQIKPILKIIKDGRQITLKSLQAGDGAEILEVERRIFAECGQFTLTTLEEFTYTAEHEEEMIQRHLEHPTKVTIVPVMDGKLIGMLNFSCGARNRNSHHGVFGVSVLPEYQGQGIGRMMVEALLWWAAETDGVETVRLQVHEKNTHSHKLYMQLGFVEEGREMRGVRLAPGQYDNVISMAKHVK